VRALKAQGMGPTEIAGELSIGRATVYRMLEGEPEPACRNDTPA